MLPSQLRQVQGLRPSLRSLAALKHTRPAVSSQACNYTSWQKQRDWVSHLDPHYERYMRRRTITTKIALQKAILRQQSWEKDLPSVTISTHRHASYSKKPFRRPFYEDEDDAHSSKSRKHRLERIRHKFDSKPSEKPHEDSFANRFEPFWNRLMPDFLKQEMVWQTPVESAPKPSTPKSKEDSFAQARSFHLRSSHRTGSKPTIQASSSSWDSNSNKTRRASYDPISGRMVDEAKPDVADAPTQASQKPSTHSKLPEDEDDVSHLTASDVRASMGKTKKSDVKTLADRTQQLATLEEDYKNKSFDSEHDELLEARKTLEALRTQVQILERRVHASTLTKPEDELDAERPAFFEDGWNDAPQGLQTAFEAEKESNLHGDKRSLEEEMNALNSAQVQEINDGYGVAPSGMQTQYELENHVAFEQEMDALNRDAIVLTNDGYSTDAKGMQTQFEKELEDTQAGGRESLEEEFKGHEKEIRYDDGYSFAPSGLQTAYLQEDAGTLEQELNDNLKRKDFDDGYSKAPVGMETLYQKEDAGVLEKELNERPKREVYDDGYSTAPRGMQTAYSQEDASTLERELAAKHKREVYDDGYSTAPRGMQTAYSQEGASTLESELAAKHKREVYDDGYSTAPRGMQTAYSNEDASTLERELAAKHKREVYDDGYPTAPRGMQTAYSNEDASTLERELSAKHKREVYDDGYSTAPSGMQTLYKKENAGVLEKELEDKLNRQEYDDGYSYTAKGMQSAFEQEQDKVKSGSARSLEQEMQDKLRSKAYDDGYSTSPSGLETAFNTEQQHSTTGKGESLEQEMKSRMEELPPTDSGYATMPIGLQVLFQQEQNNKQMSLEDELKAVGNQVTQSEADAETTTQKNDMQDHEDGYSRAPTGMQDSFRNEQNQQSPEFKQGEGDMSINVGKFCNNERWYKQTAWNNLSEGIQKAQQSAHDRELVREVRGIYENYYGPITTEHHQPQAAADAQENETVHKALDDHDLGKGEKAYTFKDDELEKELGGTQKPATTSDPSSTISGTETTSPTTPPPTMKWAEPAIYKVVAYDVHKEAISITTTPSNFSNSDNPISISNALSRLHQPARFIPHFAELQKDGYQVINASRDWLVLRKVDRGDNIATPEAIINPIDPNITRRIPYEELPTGRFASPTGFVNHDPIFTPEPLKPGPGETITVEIPVHGGPDVERYRHRRVRREEPVFSGSQRWRGRRRDGHERSQKRRFRDRMAWVLSVGVGTAACMYVVGIVSELAKGEVGKSEKK